MKKLLFCLILFSFEGYSIPAEFQGRNFIRLMIWVYPPNPVPPFTGHTWIELIDENKEVLSYEINRGGMKRNKAVRYSFCVSHSWSVDEQQAEAIINAMEERIANHTVYNLMHRNCVHLVKDAMRMANVPHPDFMSEAGMPAPSRLYKYIALLNEGLNPPQIAQKYRNYPKRITPVGTKESLKEIG